MFGSSRGKRRVEAEQTRGPVAASDVDSQVVAELLVKLGEVGSSAEVPETALAIVREQFGWAYGSFWALDDDGDRLRFAGSSGEVGPEFESVTATATFARGTGLAGRTWQSGQMTVVQDLGALTDCVRAPAAQRAGVRSGVALPITRNGTFVGTMDFFSTEVLELSTGRLAVLRSVGVIVSQAMDRLAERHLQSQAGQDITAVTAALRHLTGAVDREHALAGALDIIRQEFGWAYGSYWELDEGDRVLRFAQESGDAGQEFRQVTRTASFAQGVGLSGRAWARAELVVVDDLGQLTDCVRAPAAQRAGVRSGVCFPVIVSDRVVGTMDFFTTETLRLSESRLSALRNTSYLLSQTLQRLSTAERLTTAGHELVASIEEVERNVIAATQVAAEGQHLVADADRDIADLGNASREISNVVKVIKTIAAQTNLLALNATIEAARAGEAGRGFAVVAGEVKELANDTAHATTDVDSKVQAIQTRVQTVTTQLASIRELVDRISSTQTVISSVLTEQVAVTHAILD